jgi:hypothetical protein
MNYKDLIDIVGHPATREFDVVYREWVNECIAENQRDVDPYTTALIMFAAGYVARRNDELAKE